MYNMNTIYFAMIVIYLINVMIQNRFQNELFLNNRLNAAYDIYSNVLPENAMSHSQFNYPQTSISFTIYPPKTI